MPNSGSEMGRREGLLSRKGFVIPTALHVTMGWLPLLPAYRHFPFGFRALLRAIVLLRRHREHQPLVRLEKSHALPRDLHRPICAMSVCPSTLLSLGGSRRKPHSGHSR